MVTISENGIVLFSATSLTEATSRILIEEVGTSEGDHFITATEDDTTWGFLFIENDANPVWVPIPWIAKAASFINQQGLN